MDINKLKFYLHLAFDAKTEEQMERDFPLLFPEDESKVAKIKKEFNLDELSSLSTEKLAHIFAEQPEKIQAIYQI